MPHATAGSCRRLLAQRLQQLAQAPRLPFADLLDRTLVEQALREEEVSCRDRLFCPAVTLWLSLSQILAPLRCCRAAVARFLAWRPARRLPPCSADTSAYCKARQRLPEGVLVRLTRRTAQRVQEQ